MARGEPITLRLTIQDPVPGLTYSLYDVDGPVGARRAEGGLLSFDVPVRLDEGKLLGPFVRREGPLRRFVYIALGAYAGDAAATGGGRVKIDVHDIPRDLLDQARAGAVLEAVFPGRNAKGGAVLASVRPIEAWRVVQPSNLNPR